MSGGNLDEQLAWYSRDTGISKSELKQMCLRSGLDALQKGKLKIGATAGRKLPVFLPRPMVEMLRELCGAAGIDGGADGFVEAVLSDDLRDASRSRPGFALGTVSLILDGWEFDPDGIGALTERLCEIAGRRGGAL